MNTALGHGLAPAATFQYATWWPDDATCLDVCEPDASDGPAITARELECLRWTAEGKTAWEVGQILGISDQTAARHLSNVTRKLDCVSKHQAVVKALRLKLIE